MNMNMNNFGWPNSEDNNGNNGNFLNNNQNQQPFFNSNLINNSELNNDSLKKEIELENQIRDHLKCYICLTKVRKPKMCKYCKKICCQSCIDKWLTNHSYCGLCKQNVTQQDMIPIPFLDDMSTYFIKNIDNHPKSNLKNNEQNNDIFNNKFNSIDKNKQNIMNVKNNQQNKDICPTHNNKIDYYCIQCDNYYCSNCLVFFSEEGKKHKNHFLIQTSKMNNLGIKEAIDEYKKLFKTKAFLGHLMNIINKKIKENEIKKVDTKNFMDFIRDSYLKKIDENSNELKQILTNLESQKNSIENSIGSIPDGFNNIIRSNDYVQGSVLSNELKKYNQIDDNLENEIKEKSKLSPRLFFENYETELLEVKIPYGGQYNEGLELMNYKIDIIPNFPSKLILQYLNGKIYISFSVDIDMPLNAPNYPKFYTYVILNNQKYGLEKIELKNQSFPQDLIIRDVRNDKGRIRQQINSNTFDSAQFLVLGGDEKIVRLKLFIFKSYYNY